MYLDISDQHQQSGYSCGHQSHYENNQQVVTPFLCSRGCLRISHQFLYQENCCCMKWHLHVNKCACFQLIQFTAFNLSQFDRYYQVTLGINQNFIFVYYLCDIKASDSNHMKRIQAVCRPLQHQWNPSYHHRLSPTGCCSRPPLFPPG